MIDKITETELDNVSVESVQGEKLIGSATENKKVFDKMGRFLAGKINALIDAFKDIPIGPGSITEDYLADTVREKLDLHAESDHTHKNKDLLDKIGEDNLVNEMGIATRQYTVKGTNGKVEIIVTVHLIYGALNSENKTYFAVRQALGGVGALTPKTFATLLDEPLFLGLSGVYGITNNSLVSSKIVRRRSRQVDRQLLQERDLKDAVATVWNDYYILCVNSHCYVLDGRQKVTDRDSTTNFNYEAYYWTNVPACAFETLQDELWFGTADGRICKFNTDIDNTTKYRDGGTLSGGTITGGESIHARWSTPLDDDGYTQYFKTLNKKGTVVSFKPCEKMSADLYYVKDGKTKVYMGSLVISDGIDFTDIDFTNFVFGAKNELNELYPKRKVKKYKKLQFILENNKVDESLGIINHSGGR